MNTHDSHETIFPADPRLTAYAFGELEGDELKLIEAAVQASPELQAAVAELRAFSGELATALGDEKTDNLAVPISAPKKRRGLVIPFPLHYLATAAAACFAVVVWMRQEKEPSPVFVSNAVSEAPTSAVPAVGQAATMPEFKDNKISFDKSLAAGAGLSRSKAETFGSDSSMAAAEPVVAEKPNQLNHITETQVREGRMQSPVATAAALAAAPVAAPIAHRISTKVDMIAPVHEATFSRRALGDVSAGMTFVEGDRLSLDAESYATQSDNTYRTAATEPLSTFSIDVDTASYSNVRRFLTSGRLPPRDAVRVEELINYFPYRYTPPTADVPFAARLEVASAPWAPVHRLVRIGLKGREFTAETRPAANLVFLLDVSGSMNSPNRLPLVKESLRLLVDRLRPDDRVAIVTYAGNSGLALASTPASRKREILAALDSLSPGGSTNGAMGIHLAYDIAKANFATGGLNRVILCTDGDFNVGVTNRDELVRLISEKAKSRVFLSVFGFGMGNLKDSTLESLSAKGNGAYGYIDSRREAEKVFVEQVEGTLATIAKDVKIQVEFNPARVQSYRLIGYENRMLAKEDFNNDAVDAGDIGAGHTVTALYEIVPVGVDDGDAPRPEVDALKYQKPVVVTRAPKAKLTGSPELLTVKIRYKAPEGDVSKKQEFPLVDTGADFAKADGDFQFATAVAAWGMLLRDSPHKGSVTFGQVLGWAENGLGDDAGGYRAEFIQLVRRSAELK